MKSHPGEAPRQASRVAYIGHLAEAAWVLWRHVGTHGPWRIYEGSTGHTVRHGFHETTISTHVK